MSDHHPSTLSAAVPGAAPGWPILGLQSTGGTSSFAYLTEPSFAEMMRDPMIRQLMASDQVSEDCLNGLVSDIRRKLDR
ncbi:MAG: hypothetical protein F8N37_18750 [Telmatospirillum sp.]|nr:hypothetical protein [Telmatospirillum sp.]